MVNLANNTHQPQNIRYFDTFSWMSPLSFVMEIKEDYGFFKAGDRAVFVPLEGFPRHDAIAIVNDKLGKIKRNSNYFDLQLLNLDSDRPIFSWNQCNREYQINGLFIGILRYLENHG